MHNTIKEIVANMQHIEKLARQLKRPSIIDKSELENGFHVSKAACSQPDEVVITPFMKNALKKYDDFEDKRLMVDDETTKAEQQITDVVEKALNHFYGKEETTYDELLPLDSSKHYAVDNWRNFKRGKEMRDIQPGQAKQRKEAISTFATPSKDIGILKLLNTDPVYQKAVLVILDLLPYVKASHEIREINLPFMTKHTNIGAPSWRNDKVKIKKGSTDTWAEYTMKEAEKIKDDFSKLFDLNLSTAYGRNQRGKGRLLIAIMRIANLVLNQLEAVEIDSYKKKCPLFAGYRDDKELQKVLTEMLNFCEAEGLKAANWDQRGYDLHVSRDNLLLLGAISMYKANGARSKKIAAHRAALSLRTWLLDGTSNRIIEIFGRIFSGFIDTSRGGGIINAVNTTYTLMKQDRYYTDLIYRALYYMLVMGDDNLFIYKLLDKSEFIKDNASLGLEVHPDKGEYGIFFLQNRLYRNDKGELVMVYPWTRVLRSALMKETGKGLGPFGWLVALYQQLNKLIQDPLALKIVVNILAPFDDKDLGVNLTVKEIIDGINKEDQEAKYTKDGRKAIRSQFRTTAEKIYDGDPTKARQFTEDGKISSSFLEEVHSAIQQAYDPNFLSSFGAAL